MLALSHNISLLIFVPFLAAYLIVVAWLIELKWQKVLVRMGLIIILGLGLSAFYVGPALLELDQITISQSVSARNNNFHFNFAEISEMMAPMRPEDPSLLNPPLLIRLGWIPGLLALLGVASLLWTRSREQRGHILFMGIAGLIFLFMSTALSQFLWESLPLIEFVQFPWRFIGRAALPIAFLAGVPFASLHWLLPERWLKTFILASVVVIAVALLLLESLPALYPHICRPLAQPTITKVHDFERNTGMVGVDPLGSYFPKTVQNRPAGSILENDYLQELQPQRFDERVLPAGAIINEADYKPMSARIFLESPSDFQARYLTFAFPGWEVKVDGRIAPITPSDSEGLITFPVSTGQHLIEVTWRMTVERTISTVISIISLICLFIVALIIARTEKNGQSNYPSASSQHMPQLTFFMLLVLALGILALKLVVVDKIPNPFRRDAGPAVASASEVSAGDIVLLGHNQSQENVNAGDTFEIDLAWHASQTPEEDFQSNLWLTGPEGMIWSDKETVRPRTFEGVSPTSFWLPGQWAWDSRELQVMTGSPPGQYDIVLTLFDLADLQPTTLEGPAGMVLGPTVVIGQIEVNQPTSVVEIDAQYHQEATIGGLTLLGFNQDRAEAVPGESILLTLFWERLSGVQASDSKIKLSLLDAANQVMHIWSIPPVRDDYPPSSWQPGERLRGQHILQLPANLIEGIYRYQLEDVPLGQISIEAPNRVFGEPEFEHQVEAVFADQIALVGYTIEAPDTDPPAPLSLKLIWQAHGEIPISYRVFVHIVDQEGQILAQSDAEPADWTRPTTGWADGEYIIDEHQIVLPATKSLDNASIRLGLYDATSGTRLEVDGSDSIEVPLPNIIED
jgi:hypothetical protein